MISSKKLVKENTYAVVSQFLSFARGLVFNIIFPIIMGPLLFGQFTTLISYSYFSSALLSGFNFAMMRRTAVVKEKAKTFYSYLHSKIITAVVLIAVAFSFAALSYNWVNATQLILASFFALFLSLQTLITSYNISVYNNLKNTIGTLFYAFLSVLLPLSLYYFYHSIEAVVAGLVISSIITILMINPRLKYEKVKSKFEGVSPFSVIVMFQNLLMWGVILILSFFSASESVAFFKVALSWVLMIVSMIPISTSVVFTSLVKAKEEDEKAFKKYVDKSLKYSLLLLVPAMFGLYFVSTKMISLIYGSSYLQASQALKILSWAILPLFINNVLVSILAAMKKEKRTAGIMLFSTIFLITISIPLVYYYGLIGISLAFLSSAYLAMILMINHLRIRRQVLKNLTKPLIASIIMSVPLFFLIKEVHSLITGIILITGAALIYFATLFIIKGISKNDLKLIKHVVK